MVPAIMAEVEAAATASEEVVEGVVATTTALISALLMLLHAFSTLSIIDSALFRVG